MTTEELAFNLIKDHQELAEMVIVDRLQYMLQGLEEDLARIKSGIPVRAFSFDMDEDATILQSKIDAFKVVLEYYLPVQ